MMVGYGGTGKSGKAYHYYTCKNAKKKLCRKKVVSKQYIEDRVIEECRKLLTDSNINSIAQSVVAACEKDYDSSILKLLRKDLKSIDTAIENLWKALEQGQEIDGIRERIDKRTAEKKDKETQIAVEENREVFFTIEKIKIFLYSLKNGKINDEDNRRGIINIFLSTVYLYEDRLTLILNGGNVPITVSDILLDEIETDNEALLSSSIGVPAPPTGPKTNCN